MEELKMFFQEIQVFQLQKNLSGLIELEGICMIQIRVELLTIYFILLVYTMFIFICLCLYFILYILYTMVELPFKSKMSVNNVLKLFR